MQLAEQKHEARVARPIDRTVLALAKEAVNAAELPTHAGLLEEAHCFNRALATEPAQTRMSWFLAHGGQTRDAELDVGGLLGRMARR